MNKEEKAKAIKIANKLQDIIESFHRVTDHSWYLDNLHERGEKMTQELIDLIEK